MIAPSRAWLAHHKAQYGRNWPHVERRFLDELKQSQGGRA